MTMRTETLYQIILNRLLSQSNALQMETIAKLISNHSKILDLVLKHHPEIHEELNNDH